MMKPGDSLPTLTLEDDAGRPVSLADYRGRRLIVYFYPKDNTSGCTSEAVSIESVRTELDALGYAVVGVSPDSVKSHAGFKAKYSLGFPLLSDPQRALANAFGVYGEKKMYGKPVMGILRTTFIADESGTIVRVFEKVKAAGHGEELLASLRG